MTPNLKLTATSLSTTHCYREYAEEIFNTLLVTFYFSLGEVLCNYRHEVEYSSEWVSEEIEKQPRVLGEQEKVSLSYNYNNHPFKIIMPGYNSEKVQLIQNFYNKVIEQLPDEHPAKSN